MIAEKLKKSILQEAIQGRLVPQNPDDEPASVLLDKIRAKKRKLLTDGEIKKEPLWDNIEDLKTLPKGWAWCRLGEICIKIGSGSTPRGGKNVYSRSGIPFLRSQNILDDGINLHGVAYISEDIHKSMSSTEVHPKDILFNITGASLGRCALVSDTFPPANVNQHVTIIRLIDERLRFYIHKLLLSPMIQSMIWTRQVGMAREGLPKGTLQQFEIPLPPLDEQKRIVSALDELLPKVSEYQKIETKVHQVNISSLDKFRKSVLQAAVQGKLVPQNPDDEPASVLLEKIRKEKLELVKSGKIKADKKESVIFRGTGNIKDTITGRFYERIGKGEPTDITDELPFAIPDSWEWVRLKEICTLISGQDLSPSQYSTIQDGTPYITGASNIIDDNVIINRWTKYPKKIAKCGDLLIVCKGSIGKLAILNAGEAHIARQIMALRNNFTWIYFPYIAAVIKNMVAKLQQISQGIIPGIERSDILEIIVPIPPVK